MFVDSTEVPDSVGYRLASLGYVEGNDESGWRWTQDGRSWLIHLLDRESIVDTVVPRR